VCSSDLHVAGQPGGLAVEEILQPAGGADAAQGRGLEMGIGECGHGYVPCGVGMGAISVSRMQTRRAGLLLNFVENPRLTKFNKIYTIKPHPFIGIHLHIPPHQHIPVHKGAGIDDI
jgi:hypothetical protein